jgi:hypothetical protein
VIDPPAKTVPLVQAMAGMAIPAPAFIPDIAPLPLDKLRPLAAQA